MSPSPADAAKDLLKAFAQLRDAANQLQEASRPIEKSARRLVQSVRTATDHRAEFTPVQASDFPGLDLSYYARTEHELAAAGVRLLGDYEDTAFNRRSPDKRSFYRLGLSDDGMLAASWFIFPAPRTEPKREPIRCLVLHTWAEDDRVFVTMRGGSPSAIPRPPWLLYEYVAADTATADMVRMHRAHVSAAGGSVRSLGGVSDLITARLTEERLIAEFRNARGLELFEPMLRTMFRDKFEVHGRPRLEAIRRHPEWWSGDAVQSDAQPVTAFLRSREDDGDRAHFTTFGLTRHGLPELQMKRVAANHCRAARFLMHTVAPKLLDYVARLPPSAEPLEQRIADLELSLTRADVAPHERFVTPGHDPQALDEGPVRVRLVLEGFSSGGGQKRSVLSGLVAAFRSDPQLLHITQPGDYAGTKDEWLRESCRRLGHAAPPPLQLVELDAQMERASEAARQSIARWRDRFRDGLPADQALAVKVGLVSTTGGREYVWVRVTDWRVDGTIVGTLHSEPRRCPGYQRGLEMQIAEADVFDRALYHKAQGVIDPAPTDVVAEEFGIDL